MFEYTDLIVQLASCAAVLLLGWILMRVNHMIFGKIQENREGLYLTFFERMVKAVIFICTILLAFSVFGGISTVSKTLLGGTAIISAVVAFAAQDVLKDILAGLMITFYKPFEVGNRIQLEDGTVGIVRDITMRHVVIQALDTQRVVIPNSKINTMRVQNFSFHTDIRSAQFTFYIAYDSDVEQAMEIIRQAITESDYSIPAKKTKSGKDYAGVYFMGFEESSLRLATTVYFRPTAASEVVITDINLRVNKALKEHGIEIPYRYLNIVQKHPET